MTATATAMETVAKVETWEEIDVLMKELAELTAKLAIKTAERDKELAAVAKKYSDPVAKMDQEIAVVQSSIEEFAKRHKAEFKLTSPKNPDSKRSYERGETTIGFRWTPYRLDVGKEEVALDWLKTYRKGEYVRLTPTIDKATLLKVLKSDDTDATLVNTLANHGIGLKREDVFYITVEKSK